MELMLEKNLRRILSELDWSVSRLARESEISESTLKNWYSGIPPKDMTQVKRVAQVLGVTLDALCFEEASPKKVNPINDYSEEINAGLFEVVLRRVSKK